MGTTFDNVTIQHLTVTGTLTTPDDAPALAQSLPVVFSDSIATSVKELREDFNALLGALRSAGVIASPQKPEV